MSLGRLVNEAPEIAGNAPLSLLEAMPAICESATVPVSLLAAKALIFASVIDPARSSLVIVPSAISADVSGT